MTLRDGLRDLSATRGVRSTAVVSADGFVVESLDETERFQAAAATLAPAVAASKRLGGAFGQADLSMATVEFERGLALVVPLNGGSGDALLLLVVLESADDVGRARLAVRRVVRAWRTEGEI